MAQSFFLNRSLEYLNFTQVELKPTARYKNFSNFLHQDLRGFAPHLRKIFLYRDQKVNLNKDHWILHDLMHIIFYDYATYHLGIDCWHDYERFVECHLASEAFAVLCLDYHFLVDQSSPITVDLNPNIFKKLKGMPHYKSYEFCHQLLDLYLKGSNAWLENYDIEKLEPSLQRWIGHEVRYSQKQRIYTQAWWNDLNLLPTSTPTEAKVLNSFVADAVYNAIELIHYGAHSEWSEHLKKVKELSSYSKHNYFSELPKEKNFDQLQDYDFRFTQANSLIEKVKEIEFSSTPNPSELYLMWQALSEYPLEHYNQTQLRLIKSLHQQSNKTTHISKEIWNDVGKIVRERSSFQMGFEEKNLFFLP